MLPAVSRRLLGNACWIDPEGATPPGARLLIDGGRICAAIPEGQPGPEDAAAVDLGGSRVCPGFVDIHHHGRLIFHDAAEIDDALTHDAMSAMRHGTTAFLATSVAWPSARLADFVTRLASSASSAAVDAARLLGIHLEGPWINPQAAGAQPAAGIRPFDARHDADLLERGEGRIRMVTLAPEVSGAEALLAELDRRGIVPALGHSLASANDAHAAMTRGARHVTHLFNAMGPLHHRAPGLAGAALADDRVSCDLICDGVHVHPTMVRAAARAAGERLSLITDRIDAPPAAGPAAGFGSGCLARGDAAWRLADGRLAGSALTLDAGMRNFRSFTGASLREAVAACTLRPARVLGLESSHGTLRPGAWADFAVLDREGAVRETWIAGRRVYPD